MSDNGDEAQRKARALFESRRKGLLLLLPYRKQIEDAGSGVGMLPDPSVLRAVCAYVAGDFLVFVDGIKPKE